MYSREARCASGWKKNSRSANAGTHPSQRSARLTWTSSWQSAICCWSVDSELKRPAGTSTTGRTKTGDHRRLDVLGPVNARDAPKADATRKPAAIVWIASGARTDLGDRRRVSAAIGGARARRRQQTPGPRRPTATASTCRPATSRSRVHRPRRQWRAPVAPRRPPARRQPRRHRRAPEPARAAAPASSRLRRRETWRPHTTRAVPASPATAAGSRGRVSRRSPRQAPSIEARARSDSISGPFAGRRRVW